MKYAYFTVSSFFGLTLASISLQGFDSEQCTGSQVVNVLSNQGAQFDSSGCQTSNQFHSVTLISADAGFKCNIYADTACQNFLESVEASAVNTCSNVIGAGVICFSQALFDSPLAESKPVVAIGGSKITVFLDLGGVQPSPTFQADVISTAIGNLISQACDGAGCDPTKKSTLTLIHQNCQMFEIEVCNDDATCQQTVTISGNYDNTNQRDYMKGLLQAVFTSTHVFNDPVDGPFSPQGSNAGNTEAFKILNFASVVLNDQKGANLAEMTVEIDVQCTKITPTDSGCNDTLKTIVDAALSLVPDVGGLIAGAFDLSCQGFSS